MTDYLLVHGAGQGAWSWGAVWGYLTSPEEHPPTLHKRRRANRVHPMDLPGQGSDADGDAGAVRLEECVQAIIRVADRERLKDIVLVGHDFSASLILQAAKEMEIAPKRVVLVAGIVPAPQRPFAQRLFIADADSVQPVLIPKFIVTAGTEIAPSRD